MSKYKTGGSAFPTVGSQYSHEEGMTLRDYFAAKAMQGFVHMAAPALSHNKQWLNLLIKWQTP